MDLGVIPQLFWSFFKLGAFTLGGGYAMLPLIYKEVVDKQKWLSDHDMADIIAVSQSVPGAIAINSAVFVGFKVGRYAGAAATTIGVVLPSFLVISVIATLASHLAPTPAVDAVFLGIRSAIVVLIAHAALKIGRSSVKDNLTKLLFIAATAAIVVMNVSAIAVIISGAVVGLVAQARSGRKEHAQR